MDNPVTLQDVPRFLPDQGPEGVGSQELGKDAFLKLLTTQLQNQDPTSPVKNEDFVAQLAQFSSLEQLVGMQESLDAVYASIAAMNNASMSSLLGREVVAVGDTFTLPEAAPGSEEGAGVDLHYVAETSHGGAEVTVYDENGRVVHTGTIPPGGAGEGTYAWDGTDQSGVQLPPGQYSFSISGEGDDGTIANFQTLVVGEVNEMDYSSGLPQPSIDGVVVDLNAIVRLTSGS